MKTNVRFINAVSGAQQNLELETWSDVYAAAFRLAGATEPALRAFAFANGTGLGPLSDLQGSGPLRRPDISVSYFTARIAGAAPLPRVKDFRAFIQLLGFQHVRQGKGDHQIWKAKSGHSLSLDGRKEIAHGSFEQLRDMLCPKPNYQRLYNAISTQDASGLTLVPPT